MPEYFYRILSNCGRTTGITSISIPVLLATLFLLSGCEQKTTHSPQYQERKGHSPEFQDLLDKSDQIAEEMTEEQVDAILVGYKSKTFNQKLEFNNGVRFKRESDHTKTFYKTGPKEGDNVLHVYFDKDGYVVGKTIAGVVK
jgi:hypothetical protein